MHSDGIINRIEKKLYIRRDTNNCKYRFLKNKIRISYVVAQYYIESQ